jgi:hypothetical protein
MYANRNSLLLELFEHYFLTMAIQEAADSSLERVDFQVLLNENSAIFMAQVQRTVDRAADRNFRRIFAHSRFYLSARFLRPRTSFDQLSYHIYYLIENFKGYPMNLNLSKCQL